MNNDIPEYPAETKSAIVSSANLLIKGLVESVPDGLQLTPAGLQRAMKVWKTLSDDDQFLIVFMMKMLEKEVH